MATNQIKTPVHIPDKLLLVEASRGEERAMRRLFDRHSTAVYSVAKRILQDALLAEDVMHDLFMQIWREPLTFLQMDGDLGTMLVVLSRNRSIAVLRDRLKKGLQAAAPVIAASETYERRASIVTATLIVPFSAVHFRALDMAFYHGLTLRKMAVETGRSPQAVKKSLSFALQVLRLSMTPQVATRHL